MDKKPVEILIIGGGFGGVSAALGLSRLANKDIHVTLVSDKPHFEYKPALYRVVTGESPLEVCVPLTDIFEGKNVSLILDSVENVDIAQHEAKTIRGKKYKFDYCVLALGSEAAFFHIPGLEKYSFSFKTITEALRLKRHIHQMFTDCAEENEKGGKKICLLHFVIVGAGPSGVELAGELAHYTRLLSKAHNVDSSLVTIDLIEAASRILPSLPVSVAERIEERLRILGVNIFTNRPMTEEKAKEISVRGMTMQTETVVWTAGVIPNRLYKKVDGFVFDSTKRVLVDTYLKAQNTDNIFVIGDGAATPKSGMAQTAIADGYFVAKHIGRLLKQEQPRRHVVGKVYYSLPVGQGWAASLIGPVTLYGRFGWIIRRAADMRYFLSILPVRKALRAFRANKRLTDECSICSALDNVSQHKNRNRENKEQKQDFYTCKECGLKYKEKGWMEKCEAWCKEHHSCNLEIIQHAIQTEKKEEHRR